MFTPRSLLLPQLLSILLYLPLRNAFPLNPAATAHNAESPEDQVNGSDLWFNLGAAVALVLIGGVFAGLTIAYFSIPCGSHFPNANTLLG
jgi:metal transporter CNNM